jgi:hypothetical protein
MIARERRVGPEKCSLHASVLHVMASGASLRAAPNTVASATIDSAYQRRSASASSAVTVGSA